jgi:hypothetical protein
MRTFKWTLAVGLLLSGGLFMLAHAQKDKEADLMRRKLASSQKVLEGVATGNFKQIEQNAEELLIISKEAGWKIFKTPTYEMYSNDFRRSAETLIKNAKDKNLDAAALTYVDLTLTCVKCHKHVREVRMTRRD